MDDFPDRSLRLITLRAGGGIAFVGGVIGEGLGRALGQPVNVENWESSRASIEFVAGAAPDGYTLLHAGPSFWTAPLLKSVAYDPVRDLAPITLAVRQPNIMVAHPSLPVDSVAELIAWAKGHPGEIKCGSGLDGTSSHLAMALFAHMAKANIVRVPYANTPVAAFNDLLAGKLQMMIFSAGSSLSHIQSGELKALAVTSATPSVLAPGLPTVAAALPGYESIHAQGVYAPANTPPAIIKRINQAIVGFLREEQTQERLLNAGIEAVASTPEELGAQVKAEMARLSELLKAIGIKADK